MRKVLIGVMGKGEGASTADMDVAFRLGALIAKEGWVVLSGGRNVGVMEEVNRGAHSENGLTLGLSPEKDASGMSDAVDIVVVTDMGGARNNINVLSSAVVIACGDGGAGTASEIALALKAKKPVVLLNPRPEAESFFKKIGTVSVVHTPDEAINVVKTLNPEWVVSS